MLRRFIAFLFVIAVALPAVVMPAAGPAEADCHVMPPAVSAASSESVAGHSEGRLPAENDRQALMQHGCIGCIAPYQICPDAPAPFFGIASETIDWTGAAPGSTHGRPDTPPPRLA